MGDEPKDAALVEQLRQLDAERPQGEWFCDQRDIPDALRSNGATLLYAKGDNHGGGVLYGHTDALEFIPACSVGVPAALREIDRLRAENAQILAVIRTAPHLLDFGARLARETGRHGDAKFMKAKAKELFDIIDARTEDEEHTP
jgi:hypothetical protein